LKLVLANTSLKVARLLKKLDGYEGHIGFDTEVAGPLLRGQDFVNITYSALLGISVAFEDEECFYLPIRHKGNNASFMDLHELCYRLQARAGERKVWAHNCKFDHQVMIRAGYPMVGLLDSMVAAWLVEGKNKGIGLKELAARLLDRESPPYDPAISHKTGQDVLEYACHDALNTLQLGTHYANRMEQSSQADRWLHEECDFAMLLSEMKLQGICLDRKQLANLREIGENGCREMLGEWDKLAPDLSITSSKQLQTLFEEGIWVEHGRTSTGAFATGKSAVEHQLDHSRGDGPALAKIRLRYQEVNKIVTTYTDGLIEEALQYEDKRLHPDLHHFGTVTGRLSSSHPNIQNQPSHGEWSKRIKSCFIPDVGMEFTSADYSQVELRYFADYCGGALRGAFLDGADLHQVTADLLKVDRQLGKTINFGFLLYGGGPRKMSGLLGCSEHEAKDKIDLLHGGYPEIEEWRRRVIESVEQRGPIPWCRTRAGRVRYIPELQPESWSSREPEEYDRAYKSTWQKYGMSPHNRAAIDRALRSKGRRLVINYLVQGGSRDLLVLGMNEYRKQAPPGYSIVTTVHDEVLTQHPVNEGFRPRDLLKSCLEGAGPKLGLKVPIIAEPKTGSNWAEVK
jgi:DNA polymerase-1